MLTLVLLLTVFVTVLYLKLSKPFKYWKEKGVPYAKPWLIFGSVGPLAFQRKALATILRDLYSQFPNQRYFGFYQFTMPCLMVRDPELTKSLLIAHSDAFHDRKQFLPRSADPLWGKGLFAEEGERWRELRSIISPAFTGSKMRSMFQAMSKTAQRFVHYFQAENKFLKLEFNDVYERFTNDVIAEFAYGLKVDSLKNKDNEFFELGSKAFEFNGLQNLKFFGYALSPRLMQLLGVRFFDKRIKTFFKGLIKEILNERDEKGIIRHDLIHLLREAQKGNIRVDANDVVADIDEEWKTGKLKNARKVNLTDDDFLAQALLFFFGGFEAVARLMCQMSYELATHPEAQEKLTKEVDRTLEEYDGQITYSVLKGMKYLDMVTSETLRLWSSGIAANRQTTKPFTIEPKLPGEKPLHLDIGTSCVFPICAIHWDPNYFPNPEKFDPERFSEENKAKIKPNTYIPFGIGPRSCVASRFGLIEPKIIIFYMLSQFQFVPVKETQVPFVLKKGALINSEKGYWLGLKPREKK